EKEWLLDMNRASVPGRPSRNIGCVALLQQEPIELDEWLVRSPSAQLVQEARRFPFSRIDRRNRNAPPQDSDPTEPKNVECQLKPGTADVPEGYGISWSDPVQALRRSDY
ncbi:hypothetical protein, partial [Microvirga pakistanensis]|uniref:hypothetical protein n=1 Tax=Microvirga pakistanensis TaxID=1682650 RepID=UPI00195E1D17